MWHYEAPKELHNNNQFRNRKNMLHLSWKFPIIRIGIPCWSRWPFPILSYLQTMFELLSSSITRFPFRFFPHLLLFTLDPGSPPDHRRLGQFDKNILSFFVSAKKEPFIWVAVIIQPRLDWTFVGRVFLLKRAIFCPVRTSLESSSRAWGKVFPEFSVKRAGCWLFWTCFLFFPGREHSPHFCFGLLIELS